MKNKEKRIISLFIIIICIIIVLIVAILIFLNKNQQEKAVEENEGKQAIGLEMLNRTTDISIYLTVEECLKSYLTMTKIEEKEVLVSYLNEDFVTTKNINSENVLNVINKYKNYDLYRTMEMYEKYDVENRISIYYVKGKIDGNYVFFKVRLDGNNETFDIYPIDEGEFNSDIKKQSNENIEKVISKKTYNFYRNAYLTNEDISRNYYIDFIKLMLIDSEQAYSRLNEEYKKAKFGNIENFNNYINSNKNTLQMIYNVETADSSDFGSFLEYDNYIQANSDYKMKSYSVNEYNNYYQYVCGNITGSNIIFNAKYPLDYEVYMDSYTIDLPEFIEKYNKETDANKVLMNLEKVKGAINTKDYNYVYNKLDDTFKKNNFPTQQSFQEYINNNLYSLNSFEYNNVVKNGNLYVTTTGINDTTGKQHIFKSITFIVKLLEGTDFVMSFSMN